MEKSGKSKQLNILEGKILPKVFVFVIPLLLTNLLQTFYNAADMIVVSMSDVEGAVGSIGTTTSMINLVLNIFVGFSVGTNVIVAKNIGKQDKEATQNAIHTSIAVSVIFGVVCMAIGLVISRPILTLMGDEGHILKLATSYTFYYFLGAPFLSLSNNLIAIFRAKGDTKTPLAVLSLAGLLNIGLNLFFVLVCDMSVDGVAIATSASSVASSVVLLIILSKDNGWCRFSFKKLTLKKNEFMEILHVGIPASVQGALFSLSNMIIQSSVIGVNNRMCPGGSAVIDGNSAETSIEAFIYTATNSVYTAAVTFTSQHHGARLYRRVGDVMKSCYLCTFLIAAVFEVLIIIFKDALIGLYVTDALAVEVATKRIYITIIPYFTVAFMEVGSGTLRGLGKSMTSTVVSLIGSCVLRIIWVYTVFALYPTLESVYVSYPISWALTALIHFICSMKVRKKYMRLYPETDALYKKPYLVPEK